MDGWKSSYCEFFFEVCSYSVWLKYVSVCSFIWTVYRRAQVVCEKVHYMYYIHLFKCLKKKDTFSLNCARRRTMAVLLRWCYVLYIQELIESMFIMSSLRHCVKAPLFMQNFFVPVECVKKTPTKECVRRVYDNYLEFRLCEVPTFDVLRRCRFLNGSTLDLTAVMRLKYAKLVLHQVRYKR